jgi:hypothetical protein
VVGEQVADLHGQVAASEVHDQQAVGEALREVGVLDGLVLPEPRREGPERRVPVGRR